MSLIMLHLLRKVYVLQGERGRKAVSILSVKGIEIYVFIVFEKYIKFF
jgi:hypothetical protein